MNNIPDGFEEVIPEGFEEVGADKAPSATGLEMLHKAHGIADKIYGAGEAAYGTLKGAVAGIQAPVAGFIHSAIEGGDPEKHANRIMQEQSYQPTTEFGEQALNAIGEFTNQVGVPLIPLAQMSAAAAHRLPSIPKVPKSFGKEVEVPKASARDQLAKLKQQEIPAGFEEVQGDLFGHEQGPGMGLSPEQIAELRGAEKGQPDLFGPANVPQAAERPPAIPPREVPPPIETITQMELPDAAMARADQYGIHEGMGRVDENGMPIRADRSMEAQNLENPLQRNLWGDELPRQSEQEAPLGITAAIDKMPDLPWRSDRDTGIEQLSGNRVVPKGQRGAINMDVFDPAFRKLKELANGIKIQAAGSGEGVNVYAINAKGDMIGNALFTPDNWANPKVTDNLVADWVKSQHPGLAKEMYKFVADLGNDIIPSKVQTDAGKAMWNKFEQQGLARNRVIPASQRGALDVKDIAEGLRTMASSTSKALGLTGNDRPPLAPAVIDQRAKLRSTVEADALLKKLAPEYSDIRTPEEAIAAARDPNAKDINKNPVRDLTISGINGQVMNARNNPILNFTRSALQTARNTATAFSREFVTKDKTGVAPAWKSLSKAEKIEVAEILREAGVQKVELTPEAIDQLQLSDNQKTYIKSVRAAMDKMWEIGNDYTMSQRGYPLQKLPGYMPAIFNGAYKSLVGSMKGGVFVTEAVVQSDTRWGHNKAVNEYKAQGKQVVELPRTGLGGPQFKSDLFNGFNDIINVLAKEDPRFADLQMIANEKVNDANHKLMGFNVHELNKKGVKGSLGDKPWASREQNALELGKAVINYLEQGSDYYAHQGAANDIAKVLNDPTVDMPNAKAVVEKHLKHVTGLDVNPIGNGLNFALDGVPKMLGVSYRIPAEGVRSVKNWMSLHLMGWWNTAFLGLQLTQPFTTGMPEVLKVGSKLDVSSAPSAATAPMHYAAIKLAKANGWGIPDFVPPHLVEAAEWGAQHGIMTFSEMELAHSATRNAGVVAAEKALSIPMRLGEAYTRPPVFMTFVDMFHRFGLDNENAFRAAQHATNIAMGDYHPAERPRIYAQFGLMGEFAGALTTFKHNLGTQMWIHGRDAVTKDTAGKRQIAPALGLVAAGSLMWGVTGMPGYDDVDSVFQWATSKMGERKTIREAALQGVPEWGKSGLLSATTGLDFQSRASMARLLPDSPGSALSPQLSALSDIVEKAYNYGKFKDQASFNDLVKAATPVGMKGMVEDKLFTRPDGYVTNAAGEQLYDEPRSENERSIRKWTGVRPLRESIEQKDVYSDAKGVAERDKELKTLALRFRQAWARGDQDGMNVLAQKFYDQGGGVQELLSSEALQSQLVKTNQSQRERLTGALQATERSLNRWRDMHDGK